MKLPVKDRTTIPWMTPREIPAIKAVLSAWRKLRRDRSIADGHKEFAEALTASSAAMHAEAVALLTADYLDEIAALDERLRKEAKNGK